MGEHHGEIDDCIRVANKYNLTLSFDNFSRENLESRVDTFLDSRCEHDTVGFYFKYVVENTLFFDDEEDFSLEKLFFACNEHRMFKLISGGERHKVNCGEDHFWLTSVPRCESCDVKWFWDFSSVNLMSTSDFDIFSKKLIGLPKRYEWPT